MAFKCTGHERAPSPKQLPPDVVRKECSGEKNACFLWDYEVDGDNLTFKARILVRDNLPKGEMPDVLEHEREHWSHFHRRAVDLKAAVEKAIKEGKDTELDARLEWMKYDYCTDSAAFHRRIERYPIAVCFEPGTPRPKK